MRIISSVLVALALFFGGCGVFQAFAPQPGQVQTVQSAKDRIAVGYSVVASYANEIELSVRGGFISKADAQKQLDNLKLAKAMLDTASGAITKSIDPSKELAQFDLVMSQVRAWLSEKGKRK